MLKGTFTNCKGLFTKRPASLFAILAVLVVIAAWAGQGVAADKPPAKPEDTRPLFNHSFDSVTVRGLGKVLDLSGYRVTDHNLLGVENWPEARELRLDNAEITDEGLIHLLRMPRLNTLHIRRCSGVKGPGLERLAKLPIRSLDLSGCPIDDAGLVPISKLENLGELDLSHTKVTDAGLMHLTKIPLLGLLELRGDEITDAGLRTLSNMPNVVVLDLVKTKITLKGLLVFQGTTLAGANVNQELLRGDPTVDELERAGIRLHPPMRDKW
jgi:hypothetical protein